jgi:hypothetical protein
VDPVDSSPDAYSSTKIVVSIFHHLSFGIAAGLFFPTGMRLVNAKSDSATPWYWALNGIFGVLCSALAVFISIYLGISRNFEIAAVLYAVTLICLYRMSRGA